MDNVERVADDLYIVKQPLRESWHVCSTIVLGSDRIGLIDMVLKRLQ